MLEDSEVERALVVTAHPDDVDFGAAGTIATWTAAGIEVAYCVITNGDAGGFDPAVPREDIAGIRQAEQRAAAEEIGVKEVHFLGYSDGRLSVTMDLRRDISRIIRMVRPQRVLTQSPERHWMRIPASHPDHLAAGEATLCAVYPDARNPFAHLELMDAGFEAWTVDEVWVMAREKNNRYIDVTEVFDRKVAALRHHESQLPGVKGELEEMLRNWLRPQAVAAGFGEDRLAEAFWVIDTR